MFATKQQKNFNNLDDWFPRPQVEKKRPVFRVFFTERNHRHEPPYANYTYKALVKRSTLRLRTMFKKMFPDRDWQNMARYDMIDCIYMKLRRYYSDMRFYRYNPNTGTFFTLGFGPRNARGLADIVNEGDAIDTRLEKRGRPAVYSTELRNMIRIVHFNDEEMRGKWSNLTRMFQDIAEGMGVKLYPAAVRSFCISVSEESYRVV
jgi:hypothetical protein